MALKMDIFLPEENLLLGTFYTGFFFFKLIFIIKILRDPVYLVRFEQKYSCKVKEKRERVANGNGSTIYNF